MLQELYTSIKRNNSNNAFCINGDFCTYEKLLELIGGISSAIVKYGGSTSKKIGIVATNTIETYASILAVWFNGYAYIPIDGNNPPKRNSLICNEAQIDLVLTS
ncbi:MAG TPA: AMP-binding protein, partial [Flavitalea sp.]|nr:AMP-binding protein [Flavitalea sp.]